MRAYKSWRWNKTDWYTGKILAVEGKTLTAPDWKPNMPTYHCGHGFHCSDSPSDCLDYVNLGEISEVEILGAYTRGDKIRCEKIKIIRWLEAKEIALVAQKKWKRDYSAIIPRLQEICAISPLRSKKASLKQIAWLMQWDSVLTSVRNSGGALVLTSVWDSIRNSVEALVWTSVWDSVRNSVEASVRNLAKNSGRALTGNKIRNSVGASVGYCCVPWIKEWQMTYLYQPCIDLWLSGCVPSFNGKTWRLHGKDGRIIYKEDYD